MSKITDSKETKAILIYVLESIIKLLHPFMPFVTEEIFQMLKTDELSIMVSKWPKNNSLVFEDTLSKEWFFELIKGIRTIRNDYNVAWSKPIDMLIEANDENIFFLKENDQYIKKFLNPEKLIIEHKVERSENSVSLILADVQVYIPLGSLVDKDEEIKKLTSQIKDLEQEINRCEKMLNNPGFLAKAPLIKQEEEKQKLEKYQENLKEVKERLRELEG
jgi:valyl-tRNA synthetase